MQFVCFCAIDTLLSIRQISTQPALAHLWKVGSRPVSQGPEVIDGRESLHPSIEGTKAEHILQRQLTFVQPCSLRHSASERQTRTSFRTRVQCW
jgi:hypothetical protein